MRSIHLRALDFEISSLFITSLTVTGFPDSNNWISFNALDIVSRS